MQVLIAGSTHFDGGDAVHGEFAAACEQLGAALATAGHDLVLGSDKESTADAQIFRGFVSATDHGEVTVVRPREGKSTPFSAERERVNISYDRRSGNWASVRVHEVLQADVVLTIGGRFGTELVAQTAVALEKPVLAIPCFGGISKKLFEEFERDYRDLPDVSEAAGAISEDWSSQHPQLAMRMLGALARFNPYLRRRNLPLVLTFLATAAMIALWVFLMENSTSVSPLFAVFSVLALSVFLGTNLRFGLSQLNNPTSSLHLQAQLIHATVGLIIAFGLALIYLLGGFSVTGEWDFLREVSSSNSHEQREDFLRVGGTLSALGLTAGFLLESASSRLREWLMKMIS